VKERVYIEQADLHIMGYANHKWLEKYLMECPFNLVRDGTRLRMGDPYIEWEDEFPGELNTLFKIGVRGHIVMVFYSGWHTKFTIDDKGVDSCHCELVETAYIA